MSIILKGIDLPKDETIVIHYANRYGEMETVYVDESDIIQIPKEHGRLIDEDEIIMWGADWKKYRGMFDEIPTILEAEEIK